MQNYNNVSNAFRPYRQMDKFFNQSLNNFWSNDAVNDVPAFNIISNDNAYIISIAAPGLEKSDFDISIKDETLNISVSKLKNDIKADDKESPGKYLKKEFSYNNFSRKFKIDKTISADNIEATYTDGILRLQLQKINTPEIIRKIEIV